MLHITIFAAMGMIVPFLSVYLGRRGLSGTGIGLLMTVHALTGLVVAPVWGIVSDRSRSPRPALMAALILAAVTAVGTGIFGPIGLVIVASVLMRGAEDGVVPLADSLAVHVADGAGSRWGYGGVRVFGSLGWIISAPLAGFVASRLGMKALFLGYAGAMLLAVLLLPLLRTAGKDGASETGSDERPGIRDILSALSQDRILVGGIAALFVHGLFRNSIFRFEPLFLEDLGTSLPGIGIAGALPAIAELGAMPLAGRWIKTRGASRVLLLSFVLNVLRSLLVSLFPTVVTVMATKVLGGIGYAAMMVGSVGLVTERVSPKHFKTILALTTVSLMHLIGMVGYPIAGAIYDRFGAIPLYPLSSAGSLLAIAILLLSRRLGKPESKTTT